MGRSKAGLPLGSSNFLETLWLKAVELQLGWLRVICGNPEQTKLPNLQNHRLELGPIGSIQCALEAGAKGFDWLLVLDVDRPHLQLSTLRSLCTAATEGAVLAQASFSRRAGHPIVFSRELFEDLLRVPEGQGARWVVQRHRLQRTWVDCDDAAVLDNLNEPEDLLKAGLRQAWEETKKGLA